MLFIVLAGDSAWDTLCSQHFEYGSNNSHVTLRHIDAAHVICVGGVCIAHAQRSGHTLQTEKSAWSFEIACGLMVRAQCTG